MENTINKIQFKNRLFLTIQRFNWLIAIIAFIPVLLQLLYVAVAIYVVIRLIILLCFVLITLGLVLLNDKFVEMLKDNDIGPLEPVLEAIASVYSVLYPVLLGVSLVITVSSIIIMYKSKSINKGRIASLTIATILVAFSMLLFYLG